jgi:hypothetical protein
MLRHISILVVVVTVAVAVTPDLGFAAPGGAANGKTCRMEQQCRWENFKKICTWVKVCR